MKSTTLALFAGVAACVGSAAPAHGQDRAPGKVAVPVERAETDAAGHAARAREVAEKAAAYLRSKQDAATGGWNIPEGDGPHLPAITGLVLTGLLDAPSAATHEDAAGRAASYMLSFQQPDGGIYDRILPSYNTSIALSAIARVNTPEARAAIPKAQNFLRGLQWSEVSVAAAGGKEAPHVVGKEHPYYGGVGYGSHGRPDNSNLNWMLQALHDSGVSPEDPAFRRALVFLQRTQMDDRVNDVGYAAGSRQGGFIYATVPNAESVEGRAGQSQAGEIEETLDDGTKVSRLRAYGSMTYAGFKSYIYADLPRDDPRVRLALGWIRRNFALDENPGLGDAGRYYYYITMARALDAWGEPIITAIGPDGSETPRRWADELIDALAALQNDDGSFRPVSDRWMENDPVLITAYALIAVNHAAKHATD